MSEIRFNSIANSITLAPITGLRICKHNSPELDEEIVYFHHLETESTYRITPKTRTNQYGGERTLGYLVEITAYIPHNNFKQSDILTQLNNIVKLSKSEWKYWHLIVMCGSATMGGPFGVPYKNTTSGVGFWIELSNPEMTVEVESVELRPRIILRSKQFVKKLQNIIL